MNDLTKQSRPPEVGDYPYASCAGEDYGQVIAIGRDSNDIPTIDIEVYSRGDLIDFSDYDDEEGAPPILTRLELPPGTKAILRDVQWKPAGGWEGWDEAKSWVTLIVCRTPGNHCYRCTKLFSLSKERRKF